MTEHEQQILIKIPGYIYHTGKVSVRYQRPDGQWYESEFYPGQFTDELTQAHKEWKADAQRVLYEQLVSCLGDLNGPIEDRQSHSFRLVENWLNDYKFKVESYLSLQDTEERSDAKSSD
jgi:hypothetical protein